MSARPLLLAIFGGLSLLAPAAPEAADPAAPPAELSAAIQHQLAERDTLQRQAADANAVLNKWYNGAIDALKKDAVGKGDLDAVLILDAERDRLERDLTPEEKAKLPATLRPVRAQLEQARLQRATQQKAALTTSLRAYVASLEMLEKRLTQKLDLDGAVAVRKERAAAAEQLASSEPAPAPAAVSVVRPPPPAATPRPALTPNPMFASASPTPAPSGTPGHHLVIAGRFDTDDIVIHKGVMHIEHRGGTKPENITVNGRKWSLKWTDNRSNDFALYPTLVFGPAQAILKNVKSRAQIEIAEQPGTDADAKLVIRIRDDASGQADVELTALW